MFNLVKNELIKIFSKKGIYIVIVIFLAISILGMVLTRVLEDISIGYFTDEQIELEKNYLNQIDKSTVEGKQLYSITQTQIELLELQKKYGEDSWQSVIIEEELYDKVSDINYYKNGLTEFVINNEKSLEEIQTEYDEIIKKLDIGDWKSFAEDDLEETKMQLRFNEKALESSADVNASKNYKQQIDLLKIKIQILQWRLDKDICYGNEEFDSLIKEYENYAMTIVYDNYEYDINENNYKDKETKEFDYAKKVEYQNMLSAMNIAKYKIENNISGKTTVSDSVQSLFTSSGNGLLFIIIITIMLTGATISDEYNRGTIKLLLVRPYSRRKILASKLIACLIAILISILIMTSIEVVFSGFTYGFDTINAPVVIYDYNTGSIFTMNAFICMFINLLKVSPLIIILGLTAFMIGTLSASTSLSIVVAFLIYFTSNIINQLSMLLKANWIKFIPTLNWDLTQYSYGSLPTIEGMTMGFSIVICLITIIAILVTTFEIFVRKNIKNV